MSDSETDNRVSPPADGDGEEALREYGRQLALDSLLGYAFSEPASQVIEMPRPSRRRLVRWAATAAAVLAVSGLILLYLGTRGPSLDPRWTLVDTGASQFEILAPDRIRLISGELRFESREPAALTVETPNAIASAKGTKFLIGHHSARPSSPNPNPSVSMNPKQMTRMLVLAGMVSLTTQQGTVDAGPNEAAIALPGSEPMKISVQANTDFAFDLYARLVAENPESNLVFSPHSISNSLLMAAEGARGLTADEIGQLLGFPESLRRVGEDAQMIPWEMSRMRLGQAEINELLNEKTNDFDLRVANSIWGDRSYPFDPNYEEIINEAYGTGAVRKVSFRYNDEGAREAINQWVSRETEGMITDLLGMDSLNPETRIVLANAIYLKADWMTQFDPNDTDGYEFTLQSGEKVRPWTMKGEEMDEVRYAAFEEDGFAMVELPYRGDRLSMLVLAPDAPDGLAALEKQLSPARVKAWISQLKKTPTTVILPRFTHRTSITLNDTLRAMGMVRAFVAPDEDDGADFSGISSEAAEQIFIQLVAHQAVIEVGEKGTVAAAATAAAGGALGLPNPEFPIFRADSPFLYLIRDNKSGAVLFLGRVMDPRSPDSDSSTEDLLVPGDAGSAEDPFAPQGAGSTEDPFLFSPPGGAGSAEEPFSAGGSPGGGGR